jgi:hypothetical protein
MIGVMSDSPKDPEKTKPKLTVHPATEPSPETKVKIAAELGQGLSEALEQAVREHEGNRNPDVARRPVLRSMNQTMSFSPKLLAFVNEQKWVFAKTMPQWPHEYIVRKQVDEQLFEQLVIHIRTHGHKGRFYEKAITYYDEAGMVYWTMGAPLNETTIINRCRTEDSYEYRLRHGTLP